MDDEERFIRLEEKLARQERLLQQLNQAVQEQELRLLRLADRLEAHAAPAPSAHSAGPSA